MTTRTQTSAPVQARMSHGSEASMQYGHMVPDRRESNLVDNNGSTPFQSHLGQALGTHLPAATSYNRPADPTYRISPSPSPIHPQNATLYPGQTGQTSPPMKRKHTDNVLTQVPKRRRDADLDDSFDADGGQAGAKHWTDEEKSKLFNWLMGPTHDDHWNSLRATKNSCLRECSGEVFGGKKTYQALKGCYERNFNLFKQIYAFESFSPNAPNISNLGEADRLREYERRLHLAKKAGCDVGNISARTIDHWHRMGWYDLFYRRWHGDPAARSTGSRPSGNSALVEDDGDEDQSLDYAAEPVNVTPMNNTAHDRGHPMAFINHNPSQHPPPTPAASTPMSTTISSSGLTPTLSSLTTTPLSSDTPAVSIQMSHSMASAYLQFLQTQTNHGKMKLEYLRRREEREEKESRQRHEIERLRLEREAAEFEHNKQTSNIKQKADKAIELLGNPMMDASIKQAAGDYLKKLFQSD